MTVQQSILIGAAIIGAAVVGSRLLGRYEFVNGTGILWRVDTVTGAAKLCRTIGLPEALRNAAVPCD